MELPIAKGCFWPYSASIRNDRFHHSYANDALELPYLELSAGLYDITQFLPANKTNFGL